ncbi:MAG TPA: PTS mannitol transporter subunit IIBC [Treponema sp.]|nr:PTS mannitol transporter subunit IIBC [Treponema sp.]
MSGILKDTSSSRVKIQQFGRFMSGMVMPNLGAFIAWGLITALFIPTGWIPNEKFSELVGPMLSYLLPVLIGYTGGKMIWGARGGVVGAVATFGVVVGAGIPMLLGGMIMGPIGGVLIKIVDQKLEGKIPTGFEMLVANFSAGILALILSLISLVAIQPVVAGLMTVLQHSVGWVVDHKLLPLASLFIEPGKILFLNNAINHGVLGPLGVSQVAETGKSILFLLETNPGPGLGILLAYWLFSKGSAKASAPGAVIIHFLGGIHEIYFPYVLMLPVLIIAVIAGGATGIFTFMILGAGEVAAPSPGSIFALMAVAPKGGLLPVLMGVITSCAVSFVVAIPFVKRAALKMKDEDIESALQDAQTEVKDIKSLGTVETIVFACDAGMGTSAMGATRLKKLLSEVGLGAIEVSHVSVDDIPKKAQIVVCQKTLVDRVKSKNPKAYVFGISNLVNASEYKEIVDQLVEMKKKA